MDARNRLIRMSGLVISPQPEGKIFHYDNPEIYMKDRKHLAVDRRKLESKSSRRFQIVTNDDEQRVVALCRNRKELWRAWMLHEKGIKIS